MHLLMKGTFLRDVELLPIVSGLVGLMLGTTLGWHLLMQGVITWPNAEIVLILSGLATMIGTLFPCTMDRWLHGVKFNPYHPLTHHPFVFLGVLTWQRLVMVPRAAEMSPEGSVSVMLLDLLLLGWFIHLMQDILFRDGIPLGFKPLRRKRAYVVDVSVSDKIMNASRLAAFQPPLTWERFTSSPLRILLTLAFHVVIILVIMKITWNVPFPF